MKYVFLLSALFLVFASCSLDRFDKQDVVSRNLVENAGFESGLASFYKTAGATFARQTDTTKLKSGKYGASVEATVFQDAALSDPIAVPDGLKSTVCLAKVSYRTPESANPWQLIVHDGVGSALFFSDLPATSGFIDHFLPFTCPASGNFSIGVRSGAASVSAIYIDDLYLGTDYRMLDGDGLGSDGKNYSVNVDDSTIEINTDALRVKDTGITRAKLEAVGQQISSSSGDVSTTSSTFVDVTNLSVTITTTGRPVKVGLISDGSGNASSLQGTGTAQTTINTFWRFLRDAVEIDQFILFLNIGTSGSYQMSIPASAFNTIDVVGAGTYTYKAQYKALNSNFTAKSRWVKLYAYEL